MKILLFALLNLIVSCSTSPIESHPKIEIGIPLLSKFIQAAPVDKKILLTYITFDESKKTESLMVQECNRDFNQQACKSAENISTAPFAWNPRLHTAFKSVWVSWCEAPEASSKGFYSSSIKFQKLWPSRGKPMILASGKNFNCGQSIAIDANRGHIAYENATPLGMAVHYKSFDMNTGKIHSRKIIVRDTLVRRPSLALFNQKPVIAYDRWSATNRTDDPVAPDYNVEIAWINGRKVVTESFEKTSGLEQTPNLFSRNDELYLSYQKGKSILKHWHLRKWNGKQWLMPDLNSPFTNIVSKTEDESKQENQGAEFPQIMGLHGSNPVLTSRPSHSAFVHHFDGDKVLTKILDHEGWGARDLWMSGFIEGNHLFLARRGNTTCILEKVSLGKSGRPLNWVNAQIPGEESPSKDRPIRHKSYTGVKFGDVHMHSAYSDGTGTPDEIYARAYARRLDFAALTDHDTIRASRLFPSQYFEIMMLTDLFDNLPGMTAIQAFEWTTPPIPTGFGHKNVYFKGMAPVPVYSAKHKYGTTSKLYDTLRAKAEKGEVFTAPHHTGWTGTDWENADPKIQRHFEVASVHGVFEDMHDNPLHEHSRPAAVAGVAEGYARDGMKKGKRFGFIAGSDAHGLPYHHGHGRHENPWTQGLTGVFTNSEKRSEVFSALYEQKTFATTGPFSYVQTWATPRHRHHHHVDMRKVTFHYDVRATTPLRELKLVWNGEVVWQKKLAPNGPSAAKGEIKLADLPEQKAEHHGLYLRAIQESEHQMDRETPDQVDMIFSGPLWF